MICPFYPLMHFFVLAMHSLQMLIVDVVQASLRTMANLCRSTAYVVDPYKEYPNLLDDLMRLIKVFFMFSSDRSLAFLLFLFSCFSCLS